MNQPSEKPNSHRGVFILVFLLLCGLTGLSYWIANSWLMENALYGSLAMIGVSAAKALLVISFFMHLWWENRWKYVLTIPAILISVVLVVLLIPDVLDRVGTYSKTRLDDAPLAVESDLESH